MNKKSNKIISLIIKLLSYVIAALIILNCNTVYITSNNFEIFNKIILPVLVVATIIYTFCSVLKYNLKFDKTLFLGIGLAVYISIFVVLSAALSSSLIGLRIILYFIIFFVLAWTERNKTELSNILIAYTKLMFLIALISIFFWLFGSYLHFIVPTGSTTINWGAPNRSIPSYYNLYFETQSFDVGIRNSAIFAEAPMAALNFLISLSLSVLFPIKGKFNTIKVITFVIAGLMTMSTAMYIGILIILTFKLLKNGKKTRLLSYTLGVILIPIMFNLIYTMFNAKMDTDSGLDRKLDYMNAFTVWVNHIFMGAGINAGVNEGVNVINGEIIPHYGFSSSFTKILGDGGLFLLILIIIALSMSIVKSFKEKDYNRLTFTIILAYLFMVIIFAQNYLMFYLFIFIAIWTPKKIVII